MMRTITMLLFAGLLAGCSKSKQAPTESSTAALPEWVVGESESVALKKSTPAYLRIEQTASIIRPRALKDVAALEKLNPGLTQAIPALSSLVQAAEVSPKFKAFCDAKIKAVAEGEVMSTRSYFDCATVLDLTHASSGRTAVLFQADMDVDTDGTDPVRLPRLQDYDDARISASFQPILSYSWPKAATDSAANPFIQYYADTLVKLKSFHQQVSTEAAQDHGYMWQGLQSRFEDQISSLGKKAKYYDEDLRERRSLVASLDPFIVVPMNWPDRLNQPHSIQVGDFAAVIYGGKVYPCIIGDTGGEAKTGEASQRLAQAINPKASGRNGAVEGVGVTYLIFPKTRLAKGVPDLAVFHSEVSRLLAEIGGLSPGVTLHRWQ